MDCIGGACGSLSAPNSGLDELGRTWTTVKGPFMFDSGHPELLARFVRAVPERIKLSTPGAGLLDRR